MSMPIQLHLSLSSQSDVVLDLCEGFLGKPQLSLRNEGTDEIVHCYPFHAELERNNDRDGKEDEFLNLGRGLRYGALMITDEGGRELPINYAVERGKGSYYELMSILPGLTEYTYGFKRISPKLLDLLGRHLIQGKSYRLGFSGEPMGILCEVGEEEDPETHEMEEAKIEPSWDPYAIPFTVVAGTRKPRFTMSVTAPSPICHTSGTPKFHVIMLITSLERRPVTVNLELDDFVEMWPQNPAYRWDKWGSYDIFRITRESDGRECLLNAKHPPEQTLLPESSFDPSKGLLEFTHGTTYTYHFHLGKEDLHHRGKAPYVQDDAYILRTKPQGFAAWDYGTAEALSQTHNKPSDWCKHGPIVFEPVCDVAVTIKAVMERECPMPFFRLPPELREEVYGYLRWAEYADRIRFTADLGW